ncbi:sialidase family protein [Streptococcus halichoeri]|uniref:sialidase family protein n=1 Tax=Streptococcus halichoeri TaxID=254785 RepID=UPI0013579570|nr:exo-alpha-sialidase [Streptococcus halichoeri]
MKLNKSLIGCLVASLLAFTLTNVISAASKASLVPIFEASQLTLNGQAAEVSEQIGDKLKGNDFTLIISYSQTENKGDQALFGMSNPAPGNQNSYIDLFIRENGELGMEARDTSTQTNHLVARPAAVWGRFKHKPVINNVALVGDSTHSTYTLYANGTKLVETKVAHYLGPKNIQGLSAFVLGGVKRAQKMAYGFKGTIESAKVYDQALDATSLENITTNQITDHLIYTANDTTGSNYFRIPVLYTLSNGRILSSIDARYGGTHDFLNKINIATSYSDDNGATWQKPQLALAFDDFANAPLEWPREPGLRDLQISGGATYIDSVMVEKPNHQVVLFADVMPAGVSFREAQRDDSGYKDINGKVYLKLKKRGESGYDYTVREQGRIFDDRTNQPTAYSLAKDFSLMENGKTLTVEQYSVAFDNNKKSEYRNGKQVNMTVFYKDSLFTVVPTNYIAYATSDDSGKTWSHPSLLSPLMGLKRNAPYLSPGRGIVDSKTGRILLTAYTGKESVVIYSDDNGASWQAKAVPLPDNWSAEAQVVELSPGVLQAYMRTNNGKIAYLTSKDSGNTWGAPQYLDFVTNPKYGTELSIINYSQKIDGKKALILSTPNSPNGRRHGQVSIGLINDDHSIEWRYHHDIDFAQYGFSYSSLTELPNHDIGLMFEKFDSWSRNELHMKNVVPYVSLTIDDLKTHQ